MLRGELRLADLDPVRGNEANKRRPVVIVSNDRANSVAARLGRGMVTVVPYRITPFLQLLLFHLPDSKGQAEQVRSIAFERLGAVLDRSRPTSSLSWTTRYDSTCSCSRRASPRSGA